MKSVFYTYKKWLATNIDLQQTDDQPTEYAPTDWQPTDNWPTDCWQIYYWPIDYQPTNCQQSFNPTWHAPMKILRNLKLFSNSWVSFAIE